MTFAIFPIMQLQFELFFFQYQIFFPQEFFLPLCFPLIIPNYSVNLSFLPPTFFPFLPPFSCYFFYPKHMAIAPDGMSLFRENIVSLV